MPVVFAAITPHPPLLLPTIGKDKVALLEKTKQAMAKLEEELYVAKPNTIIIISPHSSLFPDAFSLNAHTSFFSNFAQFGDLVTKKEWKGAPELAAMVSHLAMERKIPVQLTSQDALDHGATIPLYLLTSHLPDVRILPVGYSHLPAEQHVSLGALLKDALLETDRRIAVVASGDLTHTDNPIPGTEDRRYTFDEKLIQALIKNDISKLLTVPNTELEAAKECGYRSILIALGLMQHMDYKFEQYAYEAPFGVGYLTGTFHL